MKKNTITIAAFIIVLISSCNLNDKINPIEAINQYTATISTKADVIMPINTTSFSKQAWLRTEWQSNPGEEVLLDTSGEPGHQEQEYETHHHVPHDDRPRRRTQRTDNVNQYSEQDRRKVGTQQQPLQSRCPLHHGMQIASRLIELLNNR